jgi:hypothetical protein
MIEIKLSQGAKPGHGGVLPGPKVSPEISAARGVPIGVDCVSPARHSAFSTPIEMMHFIVRLRELSGGKPVGFKLCIGHPWEFMAICKAMVETGIHPDFIVIDGSEGGTGAAPLEFVDHIGTPLREGLVFAHNCLVGAGLRHAIRLGASGKVITGFDMARLLALGADWCNAARGFMFALGCVQAQSCHTDHCPTGVATQNSWRQRAIVVSDKAARVHQFHHNTLAALADLVGAAGLTDPRDLQPFHILRRTSPSEVKSLAEVYPFLEPGNCWKAHAIRNISSNGRRRTRASLRHSRQSGRRRNSEPGANDDQAPTAAWPRQTHLCRSFTHERCGLTHDTTWHCAPAGPQKMAGDIAPGLLTLPS